MTKETHIDPSSAKIYSESWRVELPPPVLYRAGKPNPSNVSSRPGEDGVSFWDRLANPWPLSLGQRPLFQPGEPYFTIDPSRLPSGSVVPTPPEGHWIVKGVPPEGIKQAVTGRDSFPN